MQANDYNPNVVMSAELELLKLSILKNGWIQPVLLNKVEDDSGIHPLIDGFHRYWISHNDEAMIRIFTRMVPAIIFDLTVPERMLLTVRINRAKGAHVALKMHELVSICFHQYNYTKQEISQQIGANIQEIDLLLQENVFTKLNIAEHEYSPAWNPTEKRK